MKNPSVTTNGLFSYSTLVRGTSWFILCTALGIGIALWWKMPDHVKVLDYDLNWSFVLLLLPAVVIDYVLGGIRFRLLFDGTVLPFVSLWDCMRSNWANCFMGAVTPFRTGGGPAQIYILWRCGVKISQSMLVSVITFMATLFFFLIASITVLYVLPADLFSGPLERLIRIGFVLFGGVLMMLLLCFFFPVAMQRWVNRIVELLPPSFREAKGLPGRFVTILHGGLVRFASDTERIRREKKGSMVAIFIVTPVLFFNKFLMGYIIARVFLPVVPLGSIIGLQILIYFLNYFAPTPGASGIEEIASVWLLGHIIPHDILILFAILLRFVTVILAAGFGGIVMFLDFRKNVLKHHGGRADGKTQT